MRRVVAVLALLAAERVAVVGGLPSFPGRRDELNTDSTDCMPCRKLRFCRGFLGHMAADCQGDDEEEDAEDKWEARSGGSCNAAAYKQYVCARKMDPCDDSRHVIPLCRRACIASKINCENRTAAASAEPCSGLPTSHCFDTSFDQCTATSCGALSDPPQPLFCSAFADHPAVHCHADAAAKSKVEELLLRRVYRPSAHRKRCPEPFFRAYVCHANMRPCLADGVAQKPCVSDCVRFHKDCLDHSERVAAAECSANHTSFYCDSLFRFVETSQVLGYDPIRQASSEPINTDTILFGFVLVFCLCQFLILRRVRGSAPPVQHVGVSSAAAAIHPSSRHL
ncbi:hypothetical protein DIPPA_08348 [Diplonema papillatum]|nr:hypothetical protein DIPPA_08348 [Diplonema papillatum]